ncbi:hypothetical protein SUGI_0577040 [Cryptomeria japonica]|nr:hypothetical protein SUGI_0577040 [Cryptomeria japonica]
MKTPPIFPLMFVLMAASVHLAVQLETVNLGVIVDSSSWLGKVAKTAIQLAVDDVNNQSHLLNGTQMFLLLHEAQTPLEGVSADCWKGRLPLGDHYDLLPETTEIADQRNEGDLAVGKNVAAEIVPVKYKRIYKNIKVHKEIAKDESPVDLLANEVVALIQTQTPEAAPFVSELGEAANVPILSLSDSSPALSNQRFPYFVRMAYSDLIQMKAVAALVKHFRWRRIAFLHSDDDFGSGGLSALRDALRDLDSEIVYTSMIPSTAQKQTILEELYKLKTIQSSVFVVHTPCALGINLFKEAQEISMMEDDYVWITTQGFTSVWDYVLNASTMSSMQGLVGIKTHIPDSKQLSNFTERWERQFHVDNPKVKNTELNAYGLLAYDTVLMIARAVRKIARNASFLTPSTPLAVIGKTKIKVFQEGQKLLQEIFLTNFAGLSGPVKFTDGEMYGCSYEIVNVVGKSYQVIGYSPCNSSKFSKTPSFGNNGLRSVIWPGGSSKVPHGWVIPTRLKIAVPVTLWEQFINVSFNTDSNETTFSGLIIDVFDAVVKSLDYQLLYDFIPYPEDNNHNYYSYDDLVGQVYLKKYDVAVGDVTILENRSEIVDFTQPFTETGFVMVARTAVRKEAHNSWTFLQPFTPGLWATTAACVLYTGIVVWLLEHKKNPDFSGTFLLTASYTANLSSLLTTQQIAPLVNGIGDYKLGYHSSFVGSFLRDKLGIAAKQLGQTSSPQAYEEALSKGAKNGGVDAILDEIPYVRAFLSGRCGYSMVGRTYPSGGFGFVFPKASPLVQDFSKGILHLSDSGEIQAIEDKYFKDSKNTSSYSTRLDVRSFQELYLITVLVSSLALIIYVSQALYKTYSRQEISMWKCMKYLVNCLYRDQVSSQACTLEMTTKNNNLPNTNESSAKYCNFAIHVVDDANQKVAMPTSSFTNMKIINEAPSNQIP